MLIKSFTLIFKEKRETAAKQPTDDAHHSAPLLRAPARRVDDGGDDNQTAGRQGGAGRPVQWGTRKIRTSSLVHLPHHANSPPPSLPGTTTATKDNPAPAPRPRATARGVDNGCNFEGSQDGEMTTAPAPTATGPATDTGSDDDTGDSTRNDTNEHQDPQNMKNGRSTPQPRQTTQHPPQACEQLLAGWIAGASSRRRRWQAPGHQDDSALDENEHHGSGTPIMTHHPPLVS